MRLVSKRKKRRQKTLKPGRFHLYNNPQGQATIEYAILLAVVASLFVLVSQMLTRLDIPGKLMSPLTESFKYAYQYGDPTARGQGDPGGPRKHPRDTRGNGSFRLFLNPKN